MPYFFLFLILGLIVGGLTSWVFLAEHPFESSETPGGPVDSAEASLLASQMAADGRPIDEETVTKLLRLHGAYVDGEFRAAQAAAESKRAEQERATAAADMSGEEASAS